MKRNDRISASLGLTQEQLAMLLGTTRSRVSLYELNLRPLPQEAAVRLSNILLISAKGEVQFKKQLLSSEEKEQSSVFFSKRLQKNDYQQRRLEQKINVLKERQNKGLKAQALLKHLASENDKEDPFFLFMPPENSNTKYVKKLSQSQITLYEIELKVLQYEAVLLKQAIE